MSPISSPVVRGLPLALLLALVCTSHPGRSQSYNDPRSPWISPSALATSRDGLTLFVASATSAEILCLDTTTRKVVQTLPLHPSSSPSGLLLLPDGERLLVTCAAPESTLDIVQWRTGKILRSIPLGSGAIAPVLSPDGSTAYVCNRFHDAVSVVNLEQGTESRRIPVEREPVAADLTPDGRTLFVGNHLPTGRADTGLVRARISVIDTLTGQVVSHLPLPNGGNLIRDVRISPDGRFACVTHILARFQLPTTQVERGWMNANALTLVDVAARKIVNTMLLDQVEQGAANPWAAAWSTDGQSLLVTHAGTHQLGIIDFPRLLAKLEQVNRTPPGRAALPGYVVSQSSTDVPTDLSFMAGLRRLVDLRGRGPRAVTLHGHRAFVGNYFSESISVVDVVDFASRTPRVIEIPLHSPRAMDPARQGEAYFNDATLCLESWQSCASCHSSDGRVDGLNWDLMNDGKGNAKNTKSLLRSHVTAPAMSLGVRANAEVAVRAGIHHILFTQQPDEVPAAIDRWLVGVDPYPSPHRVKGELPPAAERGRSLFHDPVVGCAGCHPAPLYTNLESYDVGTRSASDPASRSLDTPTLLEIWRTAPYLHDGSAATLREVLAERNTLDQHGKTSHLSPAQIDDLLAFVLCL